MYRVFGLLVSSKNIIFGKKMKTYIYLFIFYVLAHGGIFFFPNAIFWDDYTLFEMDDRLILDTFSQLGSFFNLSGYIHIFFLPMGPLAYKFFTFISLFATGLIFDKILQNHKQITPELRFVIVIVFLTLPFNLARVTLIVLPYTISYFLFFVAWLLIDKQRILAIALFFLSFNTNSLLVFFALPFLDHYYRSLEATPNLRNFVKFCFKKIDFFILPFVFFILKNIYYKPYALYEKYNEEFSLYNLFRYPVEMFIDWATLGTPLIPATLLAIPIYHIIKELGVSDTLSKQHLRKLAILGLLAFIAGAFPYWILGHNPAFKLFYSRHQLLLSVGTSLLIVAVIY
jgi:hypothetical protein